MSLLLTFGKKSVIQRAISVLRKYGTDAHAYIPGVGVLNGLTAGNYTDTAGTQFATKDQPVGRDLDAMGRLGPELVTNGGFDSDTGWSKGPGATISGGKGVITASPATGVLYKTGLLTIGKTYKVTWTIESITGQLQLYSATAGYASVIRTSAGTYAEFITPTTGTNFVISTVVTTTAVIDNVSVKEVTGIHATQGTAGNKPVLRQGPVNLLLNSATLSTQSVAVAASPYTLSFTGTGTVTKSGTATGALVGTGATDRVTQTFTPTAGTLTLTVTGSVTSAQLQLGSTATTYIPTTSAKASAGTGPSYWELGGDGTPTDYLSLDSVPWTSADDHCVVVAATTNTSNGSAAFTTSSTAGSSRFPSIYFNSGIAFALWRDDANVTPGVNSAGAPNLTPLVISARKVGTVLTARKNGVVFGTQATTGMGAVTLTDVSIGRSLAGGFYYNGNIYCVFVIKGTITDADLFLIEKLAANLAGITI